MLVKTKKPSPRSLPREFHRGRLFGFCLVAFLSTAPFWSLGAATTQTKFPAQTTQPSPARLGLSGKNPSTHSCDAFASAPACADSLSETHAYDALPTLASPPDRISRHSLIPALLPLLISRRPRRKKSLDTTTTSSARPADRSAKYTYAHYPSPRHQTAKLSDDYRQKAVSCLPSRDPIGEKGGINLYGMVGNDAVGRWDYLGLRRPSIHGYRSLEHFAIKCTCEYIMRCVKKTPCDTLELPIKFEKSVLAYAESYQLSADWFFNPTMREAIFNDLRGLTTKLENRAGNDAFDQFLEWGKEGCPEGWDFDFNSKVQKCDFELINRTEIINE